MVVSSLILQKLETLIEAADLVQICSKHKAITALFLYAALLERGGQPEMHERFFHIARALGQWGFIWHHIQLHIPTLLREESPASIKLATIHTFPHIPWNKFLNSQQFTQLWAEAASVLNWNNVQQTK